MNYRKMGREDAERLQDIDASQYIGKAWREVDGKRELVKIDYQDPTWPNGYAHHYGNLLKTIDQGGVAIGAFGPENELVGFITVNPQVFGFQFRHVLLDQLFISKPMRGQGLGKKLFHLTVEASKIFEADKLLICAGSAEETIAFYQAMGCRPAEEIDKELYEEDPRDMQLEYKLQKGS